VGPCASALMIRRPHTSVREGSEMANTKAEANGSSRIRRHGKRDR
jgi:hypothetical protein